MTDLFPLVFFSLVAGKPNLANEKDHPYVAASGGRGGTAALQSGRVYPKKGRQRD